jgi:dihydroorotase
VLEESAPAFRNKGRLAVGADADITVFDAATVRDNATYQDPYQASTGIVHVIVDGVPVVRDGVLQAGVRPGQRILGAALRPAPDA